MTTVALFALLFLFMFLGMPVAAARSRPPTAALGTRAARWTSARRAYIVVAETIVDLWMNR